MRSAWLSVGLVLLGAAGVPLACGEVFQSAGGTTSSSGGGATTGMGGAGGGMMSSTDSASASSSSATGGMICTTAKDCPGVTTLCGQVTCTNGVCGLQKLQDDGPSFSQLYGDCHVDGCKNGQLITKVDDDDTYSDGNDCTIEDCDNGTPSTNVQVNSPCGSADHCSAAGACVACLKNSDCAVLTQTCQGNRCVPLTCTDMLKGLSETDVDCGGPCAPCEDSKFCGDPVDCKSKVCDYPSIGAPAKKCLLAVCTDGFENGQETDIDCGGPECPTSKCQDGKGCTVAGDCKSGVCKEGLCKASTCIDGMKNGTETGIDCGSNCPNACPGG